MNKLKLHAPIGTNPTNIIPPPFLKREKACTCKMGVGTTGEEERMTSCPARSPHRAQSHDLSPSQVFAP